MAQGFLTYEAMSLVEFLREGLGEEALQSAQLCIRGFRATPVLCFWVERRLPPKSTSTIMELFVALLTSNKIINVFPADRYRMNHASI